MKKIYFDANPLIGSKTGIGYLCESLIISLAESDKDCLFVGHYFNFLGKKDTSSLPKANNITYIETKLFPTKALNVLRRIGIELPVELFTRKKFDELLFTNFVSLPTIWNSKSILFLHDLGFVDHPEYVAERNGRFLRRFVPLSIKRSRIIVTISTFSKTRIESIYKPKAPILVMAVPPKKSSPEDDSIQKRLTIPTDYMLFVGTVEPRKNLTNLLDACAKFEELKEVGLVIAGGKGWKDETILKKIEELQNDGYKIIKTGYVTEGELTSLYKNARLYVQPSHYEGFGMPILEAMRHGVPVACSDLAVFREIAQDSAQYFDPNDIDSISSALVKITRDERYRTELRNGSIETANKYPAWNDVAKQLLNEFKKL